LGILKLQIFNLRYRLFNSYNLEEAETVSQKLMKQKETSNLLTSEYFEKKKFLDDFSDQWNEFVYSSLCRRFRLKSNPFLI
jgi:hypothetical protein